MKKIFKVLIINTLISIYLFSSNTDYDYVIALDDSESFTIEDDEYKYKQKKPSKLRKYKTLMEEAIFQEDFEKAAKVYLWARHRAHKSQLEVVAYAGSSTIMGFGGLFTFGISLAGTMISAGLMANEIDNIIKYNQLKRKAKQMLVSYVEIDTIKEIDRIKSNKKRWLKLEYILEQNELIN